MDKKITNRRFLLRTHKNRAVPPVGEGPSGGYGDKTNKYGDK